MPAFYLKIDPPFRDGELPYIQEPGELLTTFDDFIRKLDWDEPPHQCLLIDLPTGHVDDVTHWVACHFAQQSFEWEYLRSDAWGAFFNKHKAAWADEAALAEIEADRAAWDRHKASFSRPR